jgi:hypothetical protein
MIPLLRSLDVQIAHHILPVGWGFFNIIARPIQSAVNEFVQSARFANKARNSGQENKRVIFGAYHPLVASSRNPEVGNWY